MAGERRCDSPDANGGHVMTVEFEPMGSVTWDDFMSANEGQQVAILTNGHVLSAPGIQSPILGGATQIAGRFIADEAEQLAQQLSGR
ncbi:SecDF P1 head subdomain-containing protein [Lentzea sp. E54]|uniref:SecDF P1 head subdomain-containing protein n=1 Tax=Lentzea xerophila TaxID=3435883 RepID=UPI003DA261AF